MSVLIIANLNFSVEFVEGESSKLIQSLTLHKAVHILVPGSMQAVATYCIGYAKIGARNKHHIASSPDPVIL